MLEKSLIEQMRCGGYPSASSRSCFARDHESFELIGMLNIVDKSAHELQVVERCFVKTFRLTRPQHRQFDVD